MSAAVIAASDSGVSSLIPAVLLAAAGDTVTSGADISVAKSALEPGGDTLDVGDLLIASAKMNNTTPTWVSKSGQPVFTLKAQNITTAASAVLFRVVDGSEGSTFTFTRSSSIGIAGLDMWRIKAGTFDSANPIDSVDFAVSSVAALVLPSIAISGAQRLLLQNAARMVTLAGQSWTPPGTATEQYDVTTATNLQIAAGYEVISSSPSGTRTWTQTGTGASRGSIVAVNPHP